MYNMKHGFISSRTYLLTKMTIVVTIAAKNMKAPKAPRAMIAPRFNLAPNASLLSPSTDNGTFTLGLSPS